MTPEGHAETPEEKAQAHLIIAMYNVVMVHLDCMVILKRLWGIALLAMVIAAWHGRWLDVAYIFGGSFVLNAIISEWYVHKGFKITGAPRKDQAEIWHRYRKEPEFHDMIDAVFERHVKLARESKPG